MVFLDVKNIGIYYRKLKIEFNVYITYDIEILPYIFVLVIYNLLNMSLYFKTFFFNNL